MKRQVMSLCMAGIVGLLVAGCTSLLSPLPDDLLDPTDLALPLSVAQTEGGTVCGEVTTAALLAGQSLDIGAVTTWNDEENLYIRCSTSGGWALAETQLDVSISLEGIPQTKKGNPIVGQFTFKETHDPVVTEYLLAISLDGAGYLPGMSLYIAAHAEAQYRDGDGNAVEQEGAWATGNPFPGKNWATYFTHTIQAPAEWVLYTRVPEFTRILDVYMVSPVDGWAVGTRGRIYRFDGTDWTLHTTTLEGENLVEVCMVSATDGWAIGRTGLIYRFDGVTWALHTVTAEGMHLNEIHMLSPTDGWIAGTVGAGFYHYDGVAWTRHTNSPSHVLGLDMLSSSEGWASGGGGWVWKYESGTWIRFAIVENPTPDWIALWDMDMVSSSEGWAVANAGLIYHFNGLEWTLHTTTEEGERLRAIHMVSETEGWAVGELGLIYRFDGAEWILQAQTDQGVRLDSIFMLSSDEGWAVGSGGYIYQYR